MADPTTAYSLALLAEYTHSLDSLPLDLSRNFADLRELDAVLSSSMSLITAKINQLTKMIEDRTASPEDRLWLLTEIGDEANRLKLGGEDKIRVASAAADNLRNHKNHLIDLLHCLPNFDPSVLNRTTYYPHVTSKSYPPHSVETGRRQRRGGNLTGNRNNDNNNYFPNDPGLQKKKRGGGRDDDVEVGPNRTPRKDRIVDMSNGRPRNTGRGGGRRAASPAESLVSVTSHVQPNQSSRQPQNGPRNGAFPPANGNKRSRLVTVPSGPTDQYEISRGGRDAYMNQPPNSSSLHPSLPLPYSNGHHPLPGAEWTINNNQLEGPGMPVARGGSHSVPAQNLGTTTTSTPVDQQVDSTTGGGDEGEVDDERKYCFCDRVSYGEMIGCDDPNCEREWFHLPCLGLTTPPQGTWYCEPCKAKRNKARTNRGGKRKTGGGRNNAKA
ncbi:hypothetical protein BDM02DRAFT_3152571 [Thelephora ganbajun]|uniref:Uncharacterized protein n=1 Tax=Thelephora ganbajun TaxID=370292 RepID=A0ACB6ZXR7_THEGA|nr:hypothetical protein BDM02DRAFT_3152571 [Thelephora ganbajun]